MKYLLDEDEMSSLKTEAERRGFNQAESLLQSILDGERDLRVAIGEATLFTPQESRPLRLWNFDSPWIKLISRLDHDPHRRGNSIG